MGHNILDLPLPTAFEEAEARNRAEEIRLRSNTRDKDIDDFFEWFINDKSELDIEALANYFIESGRATREAINGRKDKK